MGVIRTSENQINRDQILRSDQNPFNEWQVITTYITEHELIIPSSAKDIYQDFIGKIRQFNGEILNEGPYRDRMLEMSNELNRMIHEIVKIIERELR